MIWPMLRERASAQGLALPTVAAEVLHVIVLDALFALSESDLMAFQGGTCLHLVHGGYRYSEDLDFAGEQLGLRLASSLVESAEPVIEKTTEQLLGAGRHEWRRPSAQPGSRLFTWWYLFTPAGSRLKHRVKLELASYPVYRAAPAAVRSELDVFGRHPLVRALPPEELLAEKLTALFGRRYDKPRDLFDLWYLGEVLRTPLDRELFQTKLADYGVQVSPPRVRERLESLESVDLESEMARFLPERYRRQLGPGGYETVRRWAAKLARDGIG